MILDAHIWDLKTCLVLGEICFHNKPGKQR